MVANEAFYKAKRVLCPPDTPCRHEAEHATSRCLIVVKINLKRMQKKTIPNKSHKNSSRQMQTQMLRFSIVLVKDSYSPPDGANYRAILTFEALNYTINFGIHLKLCIASATHKGVTSL